MLRVVVPAIIILMMPFVALSGQDMSTDADKAWFHITNARLPNPDQHWIVHKDWIEKKSVTLKRRELKLKYGELWHAYKELTLPSISKPSLSALIKPTPPAISERTYNLSTTSTDSSQVDFPTPELNTNIHPDSFSTTEIQHPGNTSHITLKVFHWHLSSDDLNEEGLGKRLDKLSAKLVSQLRKSGLKPDVFVFTGTNAITGQGWGKTVDDKYMQTLCDKLWRHTHKRPPGSFDCNQIPVYLADGSTQESNIQWANDILVISPHPVRILKATDTFLQECGIDVTYRFAYYQLLQIAIGRKKANLLVFSSRESVTHKVLITPEAWASCVSQLKEGLISRFEQKSPIVVVSHIVAPYFTFQGFARHLNARVRPLFDDTAELLSTSSLGQMFIGQFPAQQSMASRYSAVMSYRPAMDYLYELPLKAHMTPPYFYLSLRGTQQRFLNWNGYAPLRPSYTELVIETNHLQGVTEEEQRMRDVKDKIAAFQQLQ